MELLAYIADLEQELEADRAERSKLYTAIRSWADTLPPAEKQVILMRYIVGLSWSEIIDSMDYSPRQIYRFHRDAVRRLMPIEKNCD